MAVTRQMSRLAQQREESLRRGEQARTQWWISQLQQHGQRFARQKWPRTYKPTDLSRRHRNRDTQPKTERVTSYTRRI